VLLARLLALSPRLLVLDEPTRGIDVGAKVEIQNLVGEFADNGLSVVFISAELEEVLRVGHRVAILRDGRVVDTVASDDLTVDSLLAMVAQPDDADESDEWATAHSDPSDPAALGSDAAENDEE
jgi:simple sugar transport system ATP-binding protein